MVLLHSERLTLGIAAPDFDLKSVDGNRFRLSDFSQSKLLVILFICNHCPYVKAIEDRILDLHRNYFQRGVQLVGICSNDSTDYPDDSPENLLKRWIQKDYGFPYLIDETQQTAKRYGAVCTPDLFVFDQDRKLAYHGQLDNNWQDASKVTRKDLQEALDQLLNGEKPSNQQTPSMGCSIKWRKV